LNGKSWLEKVLHSIFCVVVVPVTVAVVVEPEWVVLDDVMVVQIVLVPVVVEPE